MSPAFLHESNGEPGVDPGVGYWQTARFVLHGVRHVQAPAGLPVDISDGTLSIDSQSYRNVVPMPLDKRGDLDLSLAFTDGSVWEARAAGVKLELSGEPKSREKFSGKRKR